MDVMSFLIGRKSAGESGGGTTNYNALSNKPSINGETLSGNKTAADLGLVPASAVGVANGVAELDNGGKVPSSQLPAYVDDVLEYASLSAFPATGESGKIYVALDTNLTYRWSGSAYVWDVKGSTTIGADHYPTNGVDFTITYPRNNGRYIRAYGLPNYASLADARKVRVTSDAFRIRSAPDAESASLVFTLKRICRDN